jgi:hypothetical protein
MFHHTSVVKENCYDVTLEKCNNKNKKPDPTYFKEKYLVELEDKKC